jgi:hypothetical protein
VATPSDDTVISKGTVETSFQQRKSEKDAFLLNGETSASPLSAFAKAIMYLIYGEGGVTLKRNIQPIALSDKAHGIKNVMIVHAYADESGMDPKNPIVTVAAVLLDVDCLIDVSSKWQLALEHYGAKRFHASAFYSRVSEYKNFTEDQTTMLSKELCAIFNRFVIACVSGSLARSDFRRVKADFPKVSISPYEFCVYNVIGTLSTWANQRKEVEYISIKIEANQKQKGRYLDVWIQGMGIPEFQERSKIMTIEIMSKRFTNLFELPDFASYETYRIWESHVSEHKLLQRKPFVSITDKLINDTWFYRESEIRGSFEKMSK